MTRWDARNLYQPTLKRREMLIQIKHRFTSEVIYEAEGGTVKEVVIKAVRSGAYLYGANLSRADLYRANLYGANLYGARSYSESHDILFEAIRRQNHKKISKKEWEIVGFIAVHRPCWGTIKARFGEALLPSLREVAKWGFPEYLERYQQILEEE